MKINSWFLGVVCLPLSLVSCAMSASDAQVVRSPMPTVSSVQSTVPDMHLPLTATTSAPLTGTSLPATTITSTSFPLIELLRSQINTSDYQTLPGDYESLSGVERGKIRQDWVDNWLRAWQGQCVDALLRLEEFRIETTEEWPAETPNTIVILAEFNIKPVMAQGSLWQHKSAVLDNGWLRHQGLFFEFVPDDQLWQLATVYVYPSFQFELHLDYVDSQSAKEYVLREGINMWLSAYLTDLTIDDFQLVDFDVQNVELVSETAEQQRYFVEFSVLPLTGYDSIWSRGQNIYGISHDDSGWIYEMVRYVGLRQNENTFVLESLDYAGIDRRLDIKVYEDELVENTAEEIVLVYMTRLLGAMMLPEVVSCSKLVDFRIDEISAHFVEGAQSSSTYVAASVVFSVLPHGLNCSPDGDVGWQVGNGEFDESGGWVLQKEWRICLEYQEGYYTSGSLEDCR